MENKTFNTEFIQYDEKKGKSENARLTAYLVSRSLIYVVIFFFALFFIWYFVFISTHSFYSVSGQSMMPTLNSSGSNTDAVYVDRSADPELYEIVVISTSSEDIIKRVVAVAGDYVSIFVGSDGFELHRISAGSDISTLTSSDTLIDESGVNGYTIRSGADNMWGSTKTLHDDVEYEGRFYSTYLTDESNTFVTVDGAIYVQVPENCIFYLGDNRANSKDGRDNGFASLDSVVGTVDVVVYDYNFGNRLWAVVKFYFKEIEIFFER